MNARPLILAALALALAAPAAGFSRLGNAEDLLRLGKRAADSQQEITQDEEIELGRGIAANVFGAAPLVRDEALQRYVNRVGHWLALQTERPDLPWRFGVIDSTDVNAFALPGGTILITAGLYDRLRDESELAAVLAHEISHVVEKHQVKAIQKAMGQDFANEMAGEAIGKSDNEMVRRFGGKAFRAGTEVLARGLDKQDEYQADRHGMVIAARAGYNPFAMAGVLQTLDASGPQDRAMALMFSTHPTAASRLEMLEASVGTQLDAYAGAATPERMYRPR
ncbi:MAG TPA: M48 family metalloprotease [Arenimonas sp.]|uniref:M48 family metalloprotease n=1 Tax=Arenimonas sp. TaxID=1872635 RepID=UPI002D803087|nr:M48 family metalloprotease [Arenimonas sp.]HEU0152516.1 M48 family metalloprotease [Arenimonas sp.]